MRPYNPGRPHPRRGASRALPDTHSSTTPQHHEPTRPLPGPDGAGRRRASRTGSTWVAPTPKRSSPASTSSRTPACAASGWPRYTRSSMSTSPTPTSRSRARLNLDRGHARPEDDAGRHVVRWGRRGTYHWDFGKAVQDPRRCVRLLAAGACRLYRCPASSPPGISAAKKRSYRRTSAPSTRPSGETGRRRRSPAGAGIYNTMFMWPLLIFGWELFLEICLDPRFERIMDEFAEINRRCSAPSRGCR